ncbi:MAG: hypothetical protein ACP5FN_02780 [Candidatus Micrarchaeia archaeon]
MRKESVEEKRRRLLDKAKASVSSAYAGEEHAIIEAINSYLEMDKVKNLVFERLEEWYSIYFPELRISNQVTYAKFVLKFGANKKNASAAELSELLGDKAKDVENAINRSIGREPSEEEYKTLSSIANLLINIAGMQDNLSGYIDRSVKRIMPNISYLVDTKIAAELLSRAGSLNKLALMPASTIQLLGAEKALFKHLKYGSRPPKYGILYKMPQVSNAGRHNGGRIARIYATKISIASKADAFSKRFIADVLKKNLESTISRARVRKGV